MQYLVPASMLGAVLDQYGSGGDPHRIKHGRRCVSETFEGRVMMGFAILWGYNTPGPMQVGPGSDSQRRRKVSS